MTTGQWFTCTKLTYLEDGDRRWQGKLPEILQWLLPWPGQVKRKRYFGASHVLCEWLKRQAWLASYWAQLAASIKNDAKETRTQTGHLTWVEPNKSTTNTQHTMGFGYWQEVIALDWSVLIANQQVNSIETGWLSLGSVLLDVIRYAHGAQAVV